VTHPNGKHTYIIPNEREDGGDSVNNQVKEIDYLRQLTDTPGLVTSRIHGHIDMYNTHTLANAEPYWTDWHFQVTFQQLEAFITDIAKYL
jgi:hypothetical protein